MSCFNLVQNQIVCSVELLEFASEMENNIFNFFQ